MSPELLSALMINDGIGEFYENHLKSVLTFSCTYMD